VTVHSVTRGVLTAVVLLLSSCADSETYVEWLEGVPLLLGEFRSYSAEQEVRAVLAARTIQEHERSGLPLDDTRPPFDIVTLAVPGYIHLDFPGELRLLLFNDRLQSVWFYPSDVNGYLAALKGRGVVVSTDVMAKPEGDLRVITTRDVESRTYVSWSDWRLDQQALRWITRYS
jgi:hypothetical protein